MVGKLTLDGLTVTSLAPLTVEVSVTVAPGSVLGFIVQQVAVPPSLTLTSRVDAMMRRPSLCWAVMRTLAAVVRFAA